ncbi:hypothetical protein F4801DRAFT_601000 [Xylaria longipes]|nr:hypothetical protein F4801DRAFT_601000 [Xylaria longipes]
MSNTYLFPVRILFILSVLVVALAAAAVPDNSTAVALKQDDNAVPTKTILAEPLDNDDNAATPTFMIKPRPSRTIVPDWISPPFDDSLDVPEMDEQTQGQLAAYQQNAHQNNIPERVMAGPSARSGTAPSNDGGTRQIMFHQRTIYTQFRWAAAVFRSMMLDPANVAPNHAGLSQNGEVWPRELRRGGNLVIAATGGGELDLSTDLILEFPVGEGSTYFGVDFANVNPPGQSVRRHIPSNHLLVFGYHRADVALERPLYVGMITREGYTQTTRTNWHWCPVVNYDASPGPPRNTFGYVWQGITPTFRLGTIAYFLRDWLMTTPFVKQPRGPRMVRDVLDGVDDEWTVVGGEDEELDSSWVLA